MSGSSPFVAWGMVTDRLDIGSASDTPPIVYMLLTWAGSVALALYLAATHR